jgi:hypothetical protein
VTENAIFNNKDCLAKMANTAHVNDVTQSTAVSSIFAHSALCATQTTCSYMIHVRFFYAKLLEKRCAWYLDKYSIICNHYFT